MVDMYRYVCMLLHNVSVGGLALFSSESNRDVRYQMPRRRFNSRYRPTQPQTKFKPVLWRLALFKKYHASKALDASITTVRVLLV